MRAVIAGSGSILDYKLFLEYIAKADILVCCDGGMAHFYNCGAVPNFILGDLDSALKEHIEYFENIGVMFIKFPPEKDFTDMEIGLEFALDKGADEIFIFGGIGTRFDHSLTNAHILKRALDRNAAAWLVDEHNFIGIVKDNIKIWGRRGDIVSLIPFTSNVKGVSTKGLYYGLDNFDMEIGHSLGVSNFMTEERAEISVRDGLLFVIMAKD